jgi:hypothetical protein
VTRSRPLGLPIHYSKAATTTILARTKHRTQRSTTLQNVCISFYMSLQSITFCYSSSPWSAWRCHSWVTSASSSTPIPWPVDQFCSQLCFTIARCIIRREPIRGEIVDRAALMRMPQGKHHCNPSIFLFLLVFLHASHHPTVILCLV